MNDIPLKGIEVRELAKKALYGKYPNIIRYSDLNNYTDINQIFIKCIITKSFINKCSILLK